jgi:hypothetical protein
MKLVSGGVLALRTHPEIPSKLKHWPTIPVVKVTPGLITPLLPLKISTSLPSPVHHDIMPDGEGSQLAAKVDELLVKFKAKTPSKATLFSIFNFHFIMILSKNLMGYTARLKHLHCPCQVNCIFFCANCKAAYDQRLGTV